MSYPDRSIKAPTDLFGCVLWLDAAQGISAIDTTALAAPNDFSAAAWAKVSCTVTPNVAVDPIGGNTADCLTDVVSGVTAHRCAQNVAGLVMGPANRFSVYAKAGTITWIALLGNDGGSGTWFDLANGVVGTQAGGASGSTITPAGNGWYLCTVVYAPTTSRVDVYLSSGNGTAFYAGTGTGTVFLYEASVAQAPVSQWSDRSASANAAVMATPTSQPVLSTYGGFRVVRFDGVNSLLHLTSNITGTAMSIFAVARKRGPSSPAYGLLVATHSNAIYGCFPDASAPWGGYVGTRFGAGEQMGSALRIFANIRLNETSGTLRLRSGGILRARESASAVEARGTTDIGAAAPGSHALDMDLAELLIYDRALTDGEVSLVEAYLAKKYGLVPQRLIASPLEVPGCALWLDAAKGVTEVGGVVSQWADQSGKANHAAQADPTRRPTKAMVGATPVVRFDGANDMLSLTSNVTATAQSIFAVARLRSMPTAAYRTLVVTQKVSFYASTSEAGNMGVYLGANVSSYEKLGTNLTVVGAVVDANLYLAIRKDSISLRRWRGPSFTGLPSTDIGAAGGGQAADLDLAELVIYDSALTDGEAMLVEQYLADKYGLAPQRLIASPLEVPGCQLWLDAQDEASIAKDGANRVSQWSDKSGNAKHAVQAVDANKPTYSAAGFGGLPCLDWGAGSVAAMKLVTPTIALGAYSYFVVMRGNLGGVAGMAVFHGSIGNFGLIFTGNTGHYAISANRANIQSTRNFTATWLRDGVRRVVTAKFDGTHQGHKAFLDGAIMAGEGVIGEPGAAVVTESVYIGNADSAWYPNWPLAGVIAEVIIYNRLVNAGEQYAIEQYLLDKWGIA